jgi:hypothetical protein
MVVLLVLYSRDLSRMDADRKHGVVRKFSFREKGEGTLHYLAEICGNETLL